MVRLKSATTLDRTKAAKAAGMGIRRIARELQIGVGTVIRIAGATASRS
jgi:transposase